MPANYKSLRALSISSMMLLAGCSTSDDAPAAGRLIPGVASNVVTKTVGDVQEVEYTDARTGERYQLQASLPEGKHRSGWLEVHATKLNADTVRIEWTAGTLRVTTSKPDGTAQFWVMGRRRGLDSIDIERLVKLQDNSARQQLPSVVQSIAQADLLLDTPTVARPISLARNLMMQGAMPPMQVMAAETFSCDNSIDITDNCAVEAKLTKGNGQVFKENGGTFMDENTMSLSCGTDDGLVRIQACPTSAYDCRTYPNAKTESTLTASAATDDTTNANHACTMLKAEGEVANAGRKFTVRGTAEIRPGRAVRPKDPGDEAKSPSDCKLVWDFPEDTDDVYHSDWEDGYSNAEDTKKLEVGLGAASASGSLAIGGKAEINASVHVCQDSDTGDDDYAFEIRGSRSNALYTCSSN